MRADAKRTWLRLAAALHSGDPACSAFPGYVMQRKRGSLGHLLDAATAAEVVRSGIDADDLILTVEALCRRPNGKEAPLHAPDGGCTGRGLRYRREHGKSEPGHSRRIRS